MTSAKYFQFDAVTGRKCTDTGTTAHVELGPQFCDGGTGHVQGYGTINIGGLTPADVESGTVTVLAADDTTPIPGFTGLPFDRTTYDISAISYPTYNGLDTSKIFVHLSLQGVSSTPWQSGNPTVTVTYRGDGPQMCYQTVLPPDCALVGTVVSNTATGTLDGAQLAPATATVNVVAAPGTCTPTIVTAPKASASLPAGTLADQATLSGFQPPLQQPDGTADTVTFTLHGPSATPSCSGAAVFTSTVDIAPDGTATSDEFTPTQAGTYWWVATFNGDPHNPAVASNCGEEQSVVDKASPGILTEATPSASLPGAAVSDSAALSGVTATAGGAITFKLFGPSATAACSGTPIFTSAPVAVNGPGTYGPVSTTVTQAGTYWWMATYSGDTNNLGVSTSCGDEQTVVSAAGSLIETHATVTASLPTAAVSDSATLSGVTATAGGVITFKLFGPSATAACSGTPIFTSAPVAVNGPGTYGPVSTTVTQAGTYWWMATYSGDTNNQEASSTCGDEQTVVAKASPAITTAATHLRELRSASLSDTATLSGATSTAGGTITFRMFGPSATAACSGTPVFTSPPVTVSGNGSYGPVSATVSTPGSYWWIATYSGDDNNMAVSSDCGDEHSLVIRPTIVTEPTPAASLPAAAVSDRATLSDVTDTAGGTIVFKLFGPSATAACSGTPVFTSPPVTVNGPGSYESATATVTTVGTYWWVAIYSGDANNLGASSTCGDEQSVSVKASPSIVTNPTPSAPLPNGTLVDQATLSGFQSPLHQPDGSADTVTFELFVPPTNGSCSGPLFTSTVPIAADGTATSTAFTPTEAGAYWWVATFNGDANNQAVSSLCGAEQSVVTQVTPDIATTSVGTATLPAGRLVDQAKLSGFLPPLQQPDGTADTVTFNLYGPSPTASCIGGAVFTSTVNIAADGTATSAAFTPTQTGTYWWLATFNGDQNNSAVASECGAEHSVVELARSMIVTEATPTETLPAAPVSDSATLSGVTATAGGTITFNLYGPSATAACNGTPLFTSSVTVEGPGTYGPATTTVTQAGTVWWTATYSGDPNNLPAASTCGQEQTVVAKVSPAIVTHSTPTARLPAAPVSDSATLSGVTPTAAGTITFHLYGPSVTAVCTGRPMFTSTPITVHGPGTYGPAKATVTVSGNFWWVATYSGDGNNQPVSSTCGDEQSVVTKGKLRISKTASARVISAGQNVSFAIKVTNPNSAAIAHVRVCDALPGRLLFMHAAPPSHLSGENAFCWRISSLAAHRSRSFTLVANATPGRGVLVCNHATASAPGIRVARACAKVRIKPARRVPCAIASQAYEGYAARRSGRAQPRWATDPIAKAAC